MVLHISADVVVVDRDEAAQIFPLVTDNDRIGDEGENFSWFSISEGVIFLPSAVTMMSFIRSVIPTYHRRRSRRRRRCVQPAIDDRLGRLGVVVEIAEEYVRTSHQYLVLRGQLDLSARQGSAYRAELLRFVVTEMPVFSV